MRTRYDAAINGTWLSELSDSIVVTDIREQEAKSRVSTAERLLMDGVRYIRSQRQTLSVVIAFVIWEQDVERRKEIMQRVQAWAMSNGDPVRLETNDRDGQMLSVRCSAPPSLASALKWQEELAVTFTAYEMPFWRDLAYSKTTITANGTLYVPGMGETVVDAEITNTGSSTITALTLTCGETAFAFSGLTFGAGQKLVIAHDDVGVLSAKIGDTSVLANRTVESDDELVALCNAYNSISVSGGTVSAVFKARGVYL